MMGPESKSRCTSQLKLWVVEFLGGMEGIEGEARKKRLSAGIRRPSRSEGAKMDVLSLSLRGVKICVSDNCATHRVAIVVVALLFLAGEASARESGRSFKGMQTRRPKAHATIANTLNNKRVIVQPTLPPLPL